MLQLRNTGMSSWAQFQNVVCIERELREQTESKETKGKTLQKQKKAS